MADRGKKSGRGNTKISIALGQKKLFSRGIIWQKEANSGQSFRLVAAFISLCSREKTVP